MNRGTITMDFGHLPKELKNSAFFVGGRINPDYESVKDMLTVRPYPADAHGVKDAIHKTIGDIALVLYAVLYEDGEVSSGLKVPTFMVAVWEVSSKTLMDNAFANAMQKAQPRVLDILGFLMDPEGFQGYPLEEVEDFSPLVTPCLTTERKINGAVAIFMPGVAKRIGGVFQSDFFIVFTSCHEAMLHPVTEADPDTLRAVMRDTIKCTTNPSDVLTHSIYRYHRDADEIRMV